jgi:hypothetical protein
VVSVGTLKELLRIVDDNTFNNVYGVTSGVIAKRVNTTTNIVFIDSGVRGSLEISFDDNYKVIKLSKDRFPVKIDEDILIKSIEKAMNNEVSVVTVSGV